MSSVDSVGYGLLAMIGIMIGFVAILFLLLISAIKFFGFLATEIKTGPVNKVD